VAKTKLVPGAELDVLTEAEAKALMKAELRGVVRERTQAENNGATDATGAVSIDAYQVPLGMEFRLGRIIIEADGFSYAVMFTNAAGSVTIRRGGVLLDGFNLSQGIPNTWTASSGNAPRFRNGEKVTLVVAGGPANTNLVARIEGDLLPDHAPAA
jgi:hypothetical protein